MVIAFPLLITIVLIVLVWLFIEFKRLKHKFFAIFLISLILFSYFSFVYVFKEQNLDFKTIAGIREASTLYFSWLSSLFGNFKGITTHAVQMDWGANESASE